MKAKETTKKPEAEKKSPAIVKTKKISVADADVRNRAYQIYLETGNTNEHENWVRAEKELHNLHSN